MAQENTASQQIYDLLVTRDFDPKSLDSMGKPTVNPSEADLFSFNFSTNGNEYGTVVVLINGDNDLEVYYGDNLGKGMEVGDKGDWYDFLAMIRQTAKRNLLTFSLNNMNKLKYSMATMADLSESLIMEAWKAQGKSKSYSNQPGKAKVVIQHSRAIGEGEQRFRNIASLFVENAQGERFRMPFESIAGAKAMARHVSEGGTPYDAFGQYISETINEIKTLGKFVRASRSNAFAQNEQALGIVEDAVNHYSDLKRKAKKMIGKRGYKEIFATYDPAVATELDETIESVREVFVNSAVDSRIEEALPILAKIKESTMKEANQFENWTNQIMEGTWALPETAEEIQMLKDLLAKPLPCGPDGEYATEQLYDLIGDDSLFDDISELADEEGADADCREIVKARAEELGIDVGEIDHSVYGESINENPTDQETASGYEAGQARGAAGKEQSLAMNLGGEKSAMKQTAGGQDIEESLGEDDADNTDRLSVTLDMVAPALKKLHKGYKEEADEYHTAYAEMEADGMSDEEIMNAGDDIIDYVNIDDIEDKIRAIEEVFKEGNYGEVNGNRIIAMASSGDTAMRERFMQELKYAIKDNHPEVYSKLFMYGVGESMDKDQTRMLELAGLPVKEAEEELSKCCDAPIHDGDGDADGRCTSCGEVVRVEEGMDSFVNPMDQDGTDNEKMVDPMADDDVDPEDMTEDDNDYMSADELKRELISDLNHLYDQASTNDFTDNDHILDEMGDYFKDMHANADDVTLDVYKMARDLVDAEPAEVIQFAEKGIQALGGIIEDAEMKDLLRLAGRDNVNEAKSPPEVINPTKDSSPADLKAAIKYAKYMKAKMDTDKAKATYDKEIAQLEGWMKAKSVTKETQDVDTGKEALKAERDPALTNEALERILKLSKW